jgi:maleate isomerase
MSDDPELQGRARIGMITPSSNTVLEPLSAAMLTPLAPRVTCHFTRIKVTSISLARTSLTQFDDQPFLDAAELLADARMDVIAWNGTSGAWRGTAADEALCASIARRAACSATTGTLAQLEAMRRLGVRRYALAVPYTSQVCDAIVATYAASGFECCNVACLGITHNAAFAEVPPEAIRSLVARANVPGAEAVAIICTNLASGWLVEELEHSLAKPVLDSGVVTVWQALRLAGIPDPLRGWGQLLMLESVPPRVDPWPARWAAEPFLYLTTAGRKTGRAHRIEIWFAAQDGRLYLLAGGRERSDWVRNLIANPRVTVELGDETRVAHARVLQPGTTEDELARGLLLAKYAASESDLESWGRSALPVVLEGLAEEATHQLHADR